MAGVDIHWLDNGAGLIVGVIRIWAKATGRGFWLCWPRLRGGIEPFPQGVTRRRLPGPGNEAQQLLGVSEQHRDMGPPGHVAGAIPAIVAAFNAEALGDEGVSDGPTSQARRGSRSRQTQRHHHT